MQMFVNVLIDQHAAFIAGRAMPKFCVVPLTDEDLASWSVEDRQIVADLLTRESNDGIFAGALHLRQYTEFGPAGALMVTDPTPAGILAAAKASARDAEAARKKRELGETSRQS